MTPTEITVYAYVELDSMCRALRERRCELQMKQVDLAHTLGVSTYSLSTWENCQKAPSAHHLIAWARALDALLTLGDAP